jgi:hypothetical protein
MGFRRSVMASHSTYDKIGDRPRSIVPPSMPPMPRPMAYFQTPYVPSNPPTPLDVAYANWDRARGPSSESTKKDR